MCPIKTMEINANDICECPDGRIFNSNTTTCDCPGDFMELPTGNCGCDGNYIMDGMKCVCPGNQVPIEGSKDCGCPTPLKLIDAFGKISASSINCGCPDNLVLNNNTCGNNLFQYNFSLQQNNK